VEIVPFGPRFVVLPDLFQGIERCGKDCPLAVGLCWDINHLCFVCFLLVRTEDFLLPIFKRQCRSLEKAHPHLSILLAVRCRFVCQ
jgi:hypothetical protein